MTATLQQALLAPDIQPQVVADCQTLIEQQLAGSTLVDEESRKLAIEGAHQIDEAAHQRVGSRGAERE